jgi:hypothetical protein
MEGEPHRIIKAGSAFHELDRAVHVWGGNASNSTTCKVFANVFGRPGEPILTFKEGYVRESYEKALELAQMGV